MISKTTTKFWRYYEKLPEEIKKKARKMFKIFREDPYHPSLRFKRIHSIKPIFSIRITKDYRAIGILEKDEMHTSLSYKAILNNYLLVYLFCTYFFPDSYTIESNPTSFVVFPLPFTFLSLKKQK